MVCQLIFTLHVVLTQQFLLALSKLVDFPVDLSACLIVALEVGTDIINDFGGVILLD